MVKVRKTFIIDKNRYQQVILISKYHDLSISKIVDYAIRYYLDIEKNKNIIEMMKNN